MYCDKDRPPTFDSRHNIVYSDWKKRGVLLSLRRKPTARAISGSIETKRVVFSLDSPSHSITDFRNLANHFMTRWQIDYFCCFVYNKTEVSQQLEVFPIKKHDIFFIGGLLLVGIALLVGFKWFEASRITGSAFAKVYYKDELILMIDLHSSEYILYDTPGTTTVTVDPADSNVDVPRVKLAIDMEKASIEVLYQESPRDVCELQGSTDSSLKPLVCLPNELVVTVTTEIPEGGFVPDGVLS
jgi:hypothetical protein